MDWMHLAQDKDQSQSPCEHDIEPLGSTKGNFLTSCMTVASQEGLYSIELVNIV